MKILLFSVALCALSEGQEFPPASCTVSIAEVLRGPTPRQADEGQRLWNAGVSKCLRGSQDQSEATSLTQMVDCSNRAPEQGFTVTEGRNGIMLATPWTNSDGSRRGSRCLYTGDEEGGYVWTGRCNRNCPVFAWDRIDSNGRFVMKHVATGRCARVEGFRIRLREACDSNDDTYLWQLRSDL